MQDSSYTPQLLRKRKMLLVLPLLVLPFITLAFWALGGGKLPASQDQKESARGLNLQLPNPKLKEQGGLNKLSYYEMAAADSEKWKAALRNDPYFKTRQLIPATEMEEQEEDTVIPSLGSRYAAGMHSAGASALNSGHMDLNEARVYSKLHQLNAALDHTTESASQKNVHLESEDKSTQPAINTAAVEKLEQMMQAVQQNGNTGDTEMQQINGMLDKIMDIQHPERLGNAHTANPVEQKEQALSVKAAGGFEKGFYGLNENDSVDSRGNAIQAVVHETQTLVNGATIRLRLLQDIVIGGKPLAGGSFIYGIASLSGERLFIGISSIASGPSLYPVSLQVYDLDGMPGIYVPGAISRDVSKQSVDNALQSVALSSLDPSIGAQAAGAGIETAKNLISKKVKLVRVTVKAGYRVLLIDKGNK